MMTSGAEVTDTHVLAAWRYVFGSVGSPEGAHGPEGHVTEQ